ncbi:MAG: 50S ribosomal protein L10 [Bacillota bacterium]
MVRPEKKEAVAELKEKFNQSKSMVISDYLGLDVAEITELRSQLREQGVEFKVVKNTLASIAADEADISFIKEYFVGPTAIAFGLEDAVSPAKVLVDFAKEHEVLGVKAGILNGELISAEKVKALAEIPNRETLLSQVLAGMKSPITGLVRVLDGNITGLARVLNQIKEQKEAS